MLLTPVSCQDLFLAPHLSTAEQHWVKYASSDCGYTDIAKPWCEGQSVDECKATCSNRTGCGGFNYPHGVLKRFNCLDKKASSTVDLYVLEPAVKLPEFWPIPSSYTQGSDDAEIVPSETFFVGDNLPKTLTDAFARQLPLLFPHHTKHASIVARLSQKGSQQATLSGLRVSVESDDESHPQLETDESYSLNVPTSGEATLSAKTVYGAMRGLETFSQLVQFDFNSETYGVHSTPWAIEDAPRFPWRGLMLDTSRHFQSLASIRKIIDSLVYAKLNVLHWHMSDSQSFPMQSITHPKLWEGSFSPQERYLQADIADMVEYARARGVRVMIEFDMPGHAGSWCKGYPEVCPSSSCTQPLNVASNATWDLITDLLSEVTTGVKGSAPLMKDNYVHLGGDEVDTSCWSKTPSIASWLSEQNMTADEGYAYFVKRAAEIVLQQGHRPVQWVEVFDHFGAQLDKKTVVHVWKAKSTLNAVVAAGYNALINNSPGADSWYLDHEKIKWDAIYGNEPCADIPDASQCALVLGGQGEMWGERVDVSDLEGTVWPRLAAIAERLWSPRAATDAALASGDAERRLEVFRCLLNRRGIGAAPVSNSQARSGPSGPGSCYSQ